MSKLVYLASPYTDDDLGVREKRARTVARVAGYLIQQGMNIFCPIAHSHYIAEHSSVEPCDTGKDYGRGAIHKLWMRVDISVLDRCDELLVLMLDGWEESKGVAEEIDYARSHRIPISYVDELGYVIRRDSYVAFDGEAG